METTKSRRAQDRTPTMQQQPRQQVTSEELRELVLRALNDRKFTARTLEGISAETHVATDTLLKAIVEDGELAHSVKIVPVRTADGRALLTTKDRFTNEASFKTKFIDFFATKRVALGK